MEINENLDNFLSEIEAKISYTKEELENILMPMFLDGWDVKDTVNQIKSVRDFNKKLEAKNDQKK